jgi:hypothetical protein
VNGEHNTLQRVISPLLHTNSPKSNRQKQKRLSPLRLDRVLKPIENRGDCDYAVRNGNNLALKPHFVKRLSEKILNFFSDRG